MRSFPLVVLAIVITIYILLSLSAYKNLKTIQSGKNSLLSKLYLFFSLIIFVLFILLFVYPGSARESNNYSFYFLFNTVLIADFFSKIVMLLTSLPYWISKLFGKPRTTFIYAGLIISLGIFASLFFAVFMGQNQVRVVNERLEFDNLPESFDGTTLVQLSDIHLGSFRNNHHVLEKTAREINKLQPDILLFTGDLVNNFSYETEGWKTVFQKMQANKGKYAILGNHDYGDYYNWKNPDDKAANFNEITEAYKNFGFRLLRNESVYLIQDKDTIILVGVENWGHPPFPQYADLDKAMKDVPAGHFKLLMSHDPAHWQEVVRQTGEFALTLSGHTHGLQWGIKPAGIEFSLSYFISNFWGGLYGGRGNYLYVNRGLGTIGLSFRLDMPPEITFITLKRSKIDR